MGNPHLRMTGSEHRLVEALLAQKPDAEFDSLFAIRSPYLIAPTHFYSIYKWLLRLGVLRSPSRGTFALNDAARPLLRAARKAGRWPSASAFAALEPSTQEDGE